VLEIACWIAVLVALGALVHGSRARADPAETPRG
jgi:hypothetical protein